MKPELDKIYDVIIVGAGPAGLTAALYCGRAGFATLMLEKLSPGGQMATTNEIENYPGFPGITDGFTLAMNMKAQAEQFGVRQDYAEVTALRTEGELKLLDTKAGTLRARSVILAPGAAPRLLGLPNETALRGKGVSYCATCDGAFYRGKTVAVVGGGDTAAADAVFLSSLCEKVYLIHRRDELRAAKSLQKKLMALPNVEIIWDTVVNEICGEDQVEALFIENKKTGAKKHLPVDGVFVAVGMKPNTNMVPDEIKKDEAGYIVADENCVTNVTGIFAAGDVRTKMLRQIITAAADGANAVESVQHSI